MATGTVEEKIFQRQLSKEGLQSVVDDKEQVNALSTKDLRNLFKLRVGTPSDTHDKLRCERCEIIHDNAEVEASKVLPKKLAACRELLTEMEKQEDANYFLKCLDPTEYGCTRENYEKIVKQPIDFGTIRTMLAESPNQPPSYKSVSSFSKDVNRVFANVLKVWDAGSDIADAARRLQTWWMERWGDLVPVLMSMKADDCETANERDEGCASSFENSNKRGDDYQEQIGMPDEENMRHWSHHHSTDTVDDPVFRAAMRGCDAVSFVFGLEVTWSLIQQRQQEEEERQAMEALENCVQHEDTSELESTAEDSGRVPPSSNETGEPMDAQTEGQTTDIAGLSDDEDEFMFESCAADISNDSNNKKYSKRDSVLDKDCSISDDEAEIDNAPGRDDDDDSAVVEQLKLSRTETGRKRPIFSDESSDSDSPQTVNIVSKPQNSSPDTVGWHCTQCTLKNTKSRRTCAVCGARKNKSACR